MNSVDARTVPADPESARRLREQGFDYRVVDIADYGSAVAFAQAAERGFLGGAPSDAEIERMRETWAERRNVGVYEADAVASALPVGDQSATRRPDLRFGDVLAQHRVVGPHIVAADDAGSVGRTVDLFTAYRKAKGPAELHVFQMGAHGFVNKGGGADRFMDRLEEWLRANKLLSKD